MNNETDEILKSLDDKEPEKKPSNWECFSRWRYSAVPIHEAIYTPAGVGNTAQNSILGRHCCGILGNRGCRIYGVHQPRLADFDA